MSLSQAVKDRISELMEITFDEKSREQIMYMPGLYS